MSTTFYPAVPTGVIAAPASKSETHRRMICAGLTTGKTELCGVTPSGDIAATAHCLRALGSRVSLQGDRVTIEGFAEKPELLPVYDCGESGSTLRFFVPLALALTQGGIFRMHGRLSQRPMDVYRELFVPRGVIWRMGEGADGAAELTVTGGIAPGSYLLPGDVSSQFVSGLLFALPLLRADSRLTVAPPVESAAYIRLTLQALRHSGITVEDAGENSWRIPGAQTFRAESGPLHGDWSQAAVALCMGALGGDVTVTGLNPDSIQGDRAVTAHLKALGARVEELEDSVRVCGGTLHGAALDMRDTPDIAPMIALVCQLAEGESCLTGCARLRLKESDRLAQTAAILNALGGDVTVSGDTMRIRGVAGLRGGVTLPDAEDHRMVMLAAAAAMKADAPVTLSGTEALAKSWPGFLDAYRSLGGRAE